MLRLLYLLAARFSEARSTPIHEGETPVPLSKNTGAFAARMKRVKKQKLCKQACEIFALTYANLGLPAPIRVIPVSAPPVNH